MKRDGQTDGHDFLIGAFRDYANALKTIFTYLISSERGVYEIADSEVWYRRLQIYTNTTCQGLSYPRLFSMDDQLHDHKLLVKSSHFN